MYIIGSGQVRRTTPISLRSTDAGFKDTVTTRVAAPFRLPSAHHYLEFARSSAAPILQIMAKLDDATRESAWAEIETKLSVFNGADEWAGPNELLLTTGVK